MKDENIAQETSIASQGKRVYEDLGLERGWGLWRTGSLKSAVGPETQQGAVMGGGKHGPVGKQNRNPFK